MTNGNGTTETYDRVVIGAGIFGLYTALRFAKAGYRVLIIEKEAQPFMKASYVNQARIHRGYHYPRSLSTAIATAQYVERFITDFDFAVHKTLKQVYAIAKKFSYTGAYEYEKFCKLAHMRCEKIDASEYFNSATIESAYLTDEYVYDAGKMREYLVSEIEKYGVADFLFNTTITYVERSDTEFMLTVTTGRETSRRIQTAHVINATYAGINGVIELFAEKPLKIKYEYAELALCTVSPVLKNVGLTVMDGPFFSLMPFGFGGLHSLSAVSYTPHSMGADPVDESTREKKSHFIEMRQVAKKFIREDIDMEYRESIFATKTILAKTEADDARPTLIQVHSEKPYFASIMSGKLNTIFDIDTIT